jgi:hypothetical protein
MSQLVIASGRRVRGEPRSSASISAFRASLGLQRRSILAIPLREGRASRASGRSYGGTSAGTRSRAGHRRCDILAQMVCVVFAWRRDDPPLTRRAWRCAAGVWTPACRNGARVGCCRVHPSGTARRTVEHFRSYGLGSAPCLAVVAARSTRRGRDLSMCADAGRGAAGPAAAAADRHTRRGRDAQGHGRVRQGRIRGAFLAGRRPVTGWRARPV